MLQRKNIIIYGENCSRSLIDERWEEIFENWKRTLKYSAGI